MYDSEFFDDIQAGSIRSANIIVPHLISLFAPASVLDVGCGRGAWCSAWGKFGVSDVLGIDNPSANHGHLLIGASQFRSHDLSLVFDLGRRFDLVSSLEVAEHIPENHADTFVDCLTAHGDIILFSAAPPGQGGTMHVNEQPYVYWANKFRKRGFGCFDVLRPRFLEVHAIERWYRYNMFVYCKREAVSRYPVLTSAVQTDIPRDLSPLYWRIRRSIMRISPRLASAIGRAAAWRTPNTER